MRKCVIIGYLLLFFANSIYSQNSQLPSCKLGDPVYFQNCVRYLSDEYLFESIQLQQPGLEKVKEMVEKRDYQSAFEEWGKYWRQKAKPLLVVNLENQITVYDEFIARSDKEVRLKIHTQAEKILNHEIMGWGTKTIKFGETIDFNANYGESGKYGFHYFMWSKPLYLAGLLEHDLKYTQEFDEIFQQWYDQRYRVSSFYSEWDIIYYELGLGIRNIYFLINYTFTNPGREWLYHEKMLKTMLGSGNWYYQMEGAQPYTYENRQLVAILNMGMIGLFFPEFKDSQKWVELAYHKTMEHLDKDFLPDGAHFERSPNNYTMLTYNGIRNFYYELALFKYDSTRLCLMRDKLIKTINFWSRIVSPSGEMPATNDTQRHRFPYSLFVDAVQLYGAKENMGILNSLYDKEEYITYPLSSKTSDNLPVSGYAIMRSDWSKNANYLSINYGPYSGGHSHYDILDFDIYAFNRSLALEAAMGWTYDDTLHSRWYQNSISHNMIVVNNENINKKEAVAENPHWLSNENYDYFSARDNKGYARFEVDYKRHFIFVKPDIWLIYDRILSGKKDNEITWNIHLRGAVRKEGALFKSYPDSGLVIHPALKYPYEIDKGTAMIKLEYAENDFETLQWLRFKQTGKGSMNFCSLVYPYTKNRNRVIFQEKQSGNFLIKDGDQETEILFPADEKPGSDYTSDAESILIRRKNHKIAEIQLINGSFLILQGKECFRQIHKDDYRVEK